MSIEERPHRRDVLKGLAALGASALPTPAEARSPIRALKDALGITHEEDLHRQSVEKFLKGAKDFNALVCSEFGAKILSSGSDEEIFRLVTRIPRYRIPQIKDQEVFRLLYLNAELLEGTAYDLDRQFPIEKYPSLQLQLRDSGLIGMGDEKVVRLRRISGGLFTGDAPLTRSEAARAVYGNAIAVSPDTVITSKHVAALAPDDMRLHPAQGSTVSEVAYLQVKSGSIKPSDIVDLRDVAETGSLPGSIVAVQGIHHRGSVDSYGRKRYIGHCFPVTSHVLSWIYRHGGEAYTRKSRAENRVLDAQALQSYFMIVPPEETRPGLLFPPDASGMSGSAVHAAIERPDGSVHYSFAGTLWGGATVYDPSAHSTKRPYGIMFFHPADVVLNDRPASIIGR